MSPTVARVAAALALLFAACSSGGGSDGGSGGARDAAAVSPTTALSVDVPLAATDAAPAPGSPAHPGGAAGFSHYVFEAVPSGVVTSLVEGPRDGQVRCQDVDLPCSYEELHRLAVSGDPIPSELELSRDELVALVQQLTATRDALGAYADPAAACAEDFFRTTDQVANMGAHLYSRSRIVDGVFDPSEPEILLYAADTFGAPPANFGDCENGHWTGGDVRLVGASFLIPTELAGDAHPEGFVGPLDNWHVHYELCTGPNVVARTLTAEECATAGGEFVPKHGWMIHAWVQSGYDNQLGVFSMWNPMVPPLADADAVRDRWTPEIAEDHRDARLTSIVNFGYERLAVETSETVVWSNADGVPHTVTAGSASEPGDGFDSGVLQPGESVSLTFDEPGRYPYFCRVHPQMNAVLVVE